MIYIIYVKPFLTFENNLNYLTIFNCTLIGKTNSKTTKCCNNITCTPAGDSGQAWSTTHVEKVVIWMIHHP